MEAKKIGFICYNLADYYLFKNIYKYLPRSEFIILSEQNVIDKELFKKFFKETGASFQFANKSREKAFYNAYDMLIFSSYSDLLYKEFIQEKKLIRILEDNTRDVWNFGPWNGYFDLILVNGPYAYNYLEIYKNVEQIGCPKLDDWFKGGKNKNFVADKNNSSDEKKTILYAPTYGQLSSLDTMLSALMQLSDSYNIIVWPDPKSWYIERHRIDPYLEQEKFIVKNDSKNSFELIANANFIISDNSQIILDALIFNKPLILIDQFQNRLEENYGEGLFYKKEIEYLFIPTRKKSIEQKIKTKENEIGPVLKIISFGNEKLDNVPYKDLLDAILDVEKFTSRYKKQKNKIRELVFGKYLSQSGKKAAFKIKKLPQKTKKNKSFLSNCIVMYRDHFMLSTLSDPITEGIIIKDIEKIPLLKKIPFLVKEYFL